jgi:ParB family chromosome partitioning protein
MAQLVKRHEASAAWVEVTEDYRIPDWQYREAEEGEQGGVLINLSPTGRVDIREGLVKREIDRHTAEETADNPIAPRKPKPAYSSVGCAPISPTTSPPRCRRYYSPVRARPKKWQWWSG